MKIPNNSDIKKTDHFSTLNNLHHHDIVNFCHTKEKVTFVFESELDTEEHQTEATVNRLNFGAWKIG